MVYYNLFCCFFADNVFGKWPIIDVDGNIVLCPTIAAARHLAVLYGKYLSLKS